jgi:glycosyltransferase involved in cell wall biosynthesis
MANPLISIVIRTLNEADSLNNLLCAIEHQQGIDLSRVEIIVVDNESTDDTQKIAKNHKVNLITISRKDFSYPKSMNMGVAASHAPIVILTVGHAIPIGPNWLKSVLPYFDKPAVAGVYGPVLPNKNHGFFEGIMYRWGYIRALVTNPKALHKYTNGAFGATNLAMRKSLWEEHHFEEQYELGGEDAHWAEWAFSKQLVIIREVGFTVRHSHDLSLRGLITQMHYWKSLVEPTKFSKNALHYRKDIKW